MNKSQACIDASIIVSFLTAEETSIIAEALWVELIESDVQVVAPLHPLSPNNPPGPTY